MYNLYLPAGSHGACARARARAAAARGLSAEECVPIFGRWSLWSVVSLLYNSISRSRAVDERREERERVVSIWARTAHFLARAPRGLKIIRPRSKCV